MSEAEMSERGGPGGVGGRVAQHDLTPRQYAVLTALERVHGDLGRMYFAGILVLLDGVNPLRNQLCAHALRELMEKLPKYFDVEIKSHADSPADQLAALCSDLLNVKAARQQEQAGDVWRGEVDDVLAEFLHNVDRIAESTAKPVGYRRLEIREALKRTDSLAKVVPESLTSRNEKEWLALRSYFADASHNNSRADSALFLEKVEVLESILLDRFAPKTFDDLAKLDALILEGGDAPNDAQIEFALAQLRKRGANYGYFLANVASSGWLAALERMELFKSPPAAIREGSDVVFPPWPEGDFLVRVADEAPAHVARILARIPDTDNATVHRIVLEAASRLPTGQAKKLADREARWIAARERLEFLVAERAAALIRRLAAGGEVASAVRLATAVFGVEESTGQECVSRLEGWHFSTLLAECVPTLLRASPERVFDLLCDWLTSVLSSDGASKPEDYSFVWRPAIEDHVQNRGADDVQSALVSCVRDAALSVIDGALIAPADLLTLLERREWCLFQRLALFVQTERHSMLTVEARASVLSKDRFDSPALFREYMRLLRVALPTLDESEQALVFGWIHATPPEPEASDEMPERRALRRLVLLEDVLPPEHRSVLETLRAKHGSPDNPDFNSYIKTWTGPTSPAVALQSLTPEEVARFCSTWVPDGGWGTASREGLSRRIESDVAKRFAEYVSALPAFHGTDCTYARAIVEGLRSALKGGSTFQWTTVLEFLEWIVLQEREVPERAGEDDEDGDPHWGWARKSVATLVGTACERDELPGALRERAWAILDVLRHDPNPSAEDDARTSMDPATHSINTTRGAALHAVVRFAGWECRADKSSGTPGLRADVARALEEHLDPTLDPSPAIRAVYGQWLPWLILMARDWVVGMLPRLFPEAPEHEALRQAAWETYVTFCHAYDDTFPVLCDAYQEATTRLGTESPDRKRRRDHQDALGEHLMSLACRGTISVDSDDGLIRAFFDRAPDPVAEHAIAYLGRLLSSDDDEPPQEYLDRLMSLWEYVLAVLRDRAPARREPLKAFGWWFGSGRFDSRWAATQLEDALSLAGKLDAVWHVVERLQELSTTEPASAVRLLERVLKTDRHGWAVTAWKNHVEAVLVAGLAHEATADATRQIIHSLGARGHMEFRRLL